MTVASNYCSSLVTMFSSQVTASLVMKYILKETVRDIDQIIHKICRLLANLQLPTATAVTHSSQDIGNIKCRTRPPIVPIVWWYYFIDVSVSVMALMNISA